jgi:hypothetical protein
VTGTGNEPFYLKQDEFQVSVKDATNGASITLRPIGHNIKIKM